MLRSMDELAFGVARQLTALTFMQTILNTRDAACER